MTEENKLSKIFYDDREAIKVYIGLKEPYSTVDIAPVVGIKGDNEHIELRYIITDTHYKFYDRDDIDPDDCITLWGIRKDEKLVIKHDIEKGIFIQQIKTNTQNTVVSRLFLPISRVTHIVVNEAQEMDYPDDDIPK